MKITQPILQIGDLLCDAIPTERYHLQLIRDFFKTIPKPIYGCHENDVNSKCVVDKQYITHEIRDIYFNDSVTKLLCDVELLDTLNGRSIKSLIDKGLKVKLHLWTNLYKVSSSLDVTALGIQLINEYQHSNVLTANIKIKEL